VFFCQVQSTNQLLEVEAMSTPYEGDSKTKGTHGVWGESNPVAGRGVVGLSDSGTGVWGDTKSGRAVVGVVRTQGDAVWGETKTGRGVVGACDGDGSGVWGETNSGRGVVGVVHTQGDGVWGETKVGRGVVGVCQGQDQGVWGTSDRGDGVHGETNSLTWSAGVSGFAINAEGIGPGLLGRSNGSGPGVFGQGSRDAGVIGFHGDPRLQETTVGSDGAKAGVFGASDIGPGILGYASRNTSAAVVAFGGLRSSAMTYPFAGEFFGKVQVNGDLQVQGDIFLPGADCAEHFDVSDAGLIEAGDVVVIDQAGNLERSSTPYDRKVAGVVSGAGRFRPGIVLDKQEAGNRLPVALVGKVYCKVDADFGRIDVGDLLTSSPTGGHAMKAEDSAKSFGAVIGKALGSLATGQGLVPMLVCLQ
jgi:hypothetical protein